ncbi:GAF domain-containing protein [Kribbella jiaozuonensis]|uniref:GAF domain-containing protein n=1 Tax=Kribbella jiaozuonensis TaxID=2575441 RepID=UPI00192DD345|nr:GAF domain-containing protein [Kribbella jiaozuonensis]
MVSLGWVRLRGSLLLRCVAALAAGALAFWLAAVVCTAARDHVPAVVVGVLLLIVVFGIARLGGITYALPVGVAVILAFDWYLLPPLRTLDAATVLLLVLFLVMSVIVAAVTAEAGRRSVEAERARGDLADTQAALRRLALLVAAGEPPATVFGAVTQEVARHFGGDTARMIRFEPDGTATLVASDGTTGPHVRIGGPWEGYPPTGLTATVQRTGQAARVDDYASVPGGEPYLREGLRAAVAMPVHVDGRVWGLIALGSRHGPLPAGAEDRLTDFTNLVAMAVANAQSRADVMTSRARLVTASDEARRRIERNLHDGAQQRLVSLALGLRSAATGFTGSEETRAEIEQIAMGLVEVIDELRELSRGIHPAILSESGLGPALRALARRSTVEVKLEARIEGRLPEPVEVAAYYVVSEMLANAAKYAQATAVHVRAEMSDGQLLLVVQDDGIGGADPARGSGLVGLKDRLDALGGSFTVDSPPGAGTKAVCELPISS